MLYEDNGWLLRFDRWYICGADLLAYFSGWGCTNRCPWTRIKCRYLFRWHFLSLVSTILCWGVWIAEETWFSGMFVERRYCFGRRQSFFWEQMTDEFFYLWLSTLFHKLRCLFSLQCRIFWRYGARSSRGPSFIYYQKYYRLVTVVIIIRKSIKIRKSGEKDKIRLLQNHGWDIFLEPIKSTHKAKLLANWWEDGPRNQNRLR